MRRVKKFKLNADNNIVLGDGTIIQTKGDRGLPGDKGVPGDQGEGVEEGSSQFSPIAIKGDKGDRGEKGYHGRDGEDGEDIWPIPGKDGSIGPPGLMGISGRDGEDSEEDWLSLRMGAHGSFADDDHPQYQKESEKDAASGYAGLSATSRVTKGVDTEDDVIIDLATKGVVLKDVADPPHYWRLNISILGVISTTDLGHAEP